MKINRLKITTAGVVLMSALALNGCNNLEEKEEVVTKTEQGRLSSDDKGIVEDFLKTGVMPEDEFIPHTHVILSVDGYFVSVRECEDYIGFIDAVIDEHSVTYVIKNVFGEVLFEVPTTSELYVLGVDSYDKELELRNAEEVKVKSLNKTR